MPKSAPVTLQSSIEDFDPAIDRVEVLINRATNCADRITGTRPSEVGVTDKNPVASGLITAVQERRSRLARAVDRLESEVSRIESGLS
jgi:hypothetical protein